VSDNKSPVYWWISQRHPDDDPCRSKHAAALFKVLHSAVTFFCTWRGSISVKEVCCNWGRSAELAVLKTEHDTEF